MVKLEKEYQQAARRSEAPGFCKARGSVVLAVQVQSDWPAAVTAA